MADSRAVPDAPAGQGAGRGMTAGYEYSTYGEEARGSGWLTYAAVLITMAGALNFGYGLAAILKSHFYVANTRFVVSDLNTWGWVVMLTGILEFCVAAGVWMRAQWARWTAVVLASLNGIAQLLFIPAYPWLSLAIFTLDLLAIYGLVAYGGRVQQT
jgi:hypothetical protein